MAVINSAGTISDRYTYTPYGVQTITTSGVSNPIAFQSGYQDATGLIKYGTRYYDPLADRWLQPDPANQATTDPYIFDGDDPINQEDPYGLSTGGFARACIKGAVTGATVGVVTSGGTLSAEEAGAGCAVGVVVYDISQVNEVAGQAAEVISGVKDLASEFSSLF